MQKDGWSIMQMIPFLFLKNKESHSHCVMIIHICGPKFFCQSWSVYKHMSVTWKDGCFQIHFFSLFFFQKDFMYPLIPCDQSLWSIFLSFFLPILSGKLLWTEVGAASIKIKHFLATLLECTYDPRMKWTWLSGRF